MEVFVKVSSRTRIEAYNRLRGQERKARVGLSQAAAVLVVGVEAGVLLALCGVSSW